MGYISDMLSNVSKSLPPLDLHFLLQNGTNLCSLLHVRDRRYRRHIGVRRCSYPAGTASSILVTNQQFARNARRKNERANSMEASYQNTPQYQRFAGAICQRLAAVGLREAARNGGGSLSPNVSLQLESLGRTLSVSPETFTLTGAFDMWHELVILQYLADGDGCAPAGAWMGLSDFSEGGLIRGTSFDAEIRQNAARQFSGFSQQDLNRACQAIGGAESGSSADVAFTFMLAPHLPLLAYIWLGDDEFPASAKVLVDANAEHYLGVEAAGTAASMLIDMLGRELRKA